jgi:hypothetical protein
MTTQFVVRDTFHPAEDISRNWSSFSGGYDEYGNVFNSTEDARNWYESEGLKMHEFRYHPAYNRIAPVHYEGLGAWALDSETLENAIKEASEMEDLLACTMESGNGHFYAYQVISYHEVREGRWVFQVTI